MATNQLSEQEIQFRKRARRRLVGAIALVLLMVTVLPMVLDDREVKPTQQDIAITIPSQDGAGFSSRIVPAAPSPEQSVAGQTLPLAPPLEKPQPPVGREAEASPAKPPAVQQEKPLPIAKPQPSPEPALAKPAEPVAVVKQELPKPATATDTAKGTFSLQIGVFTETPKLKQLESKLATQGFHATREKLKTPKGVKIRLRTGPYPTRAEAEAAQARLKSAGMNGMVVANK